MITNLDEQHFATLMHWIRERERIRIAKDACKPWPWTADPILREWRFCNVNRCDDTVTRWIFEHVIALHRDSPTLWFNLTIARLINWPDSLQALGYFDAWDPERFVAGLQGRKGKVWTSAYMIPAGPEGIPKARYLADVTLSSLWDARSRCPIDGRCNSWGRFLELARGIGGFLANQIVTDVKYSPALEHAPDWSTFVIAGPGTSRGLNRIFRRKLGAGWRREDAARRLVELRDAVVEAEPSMVVIMRDLNNLSNSLCEFDKYERVRNGEGHPRVRYAPPAPDQLFFL